MSTLTLAPLFGPDVGGEPTLEVLLDEAWAALARGVTVTCPVCEGEMHPEYAQHALPIAARCTSCGSVLD